MAFPFPSGPLQSSLLGVVALGVLGSGSLALAQVSAKPPSASPIQAQSQPQGIDLTGVKLSDLVRLYLERIDARPYVACADLVQDTRLVSLRADQASLRDAIMGVLRRHGYEFTTTGNVTYVCPAVAAQQAAQASAPISAPPAVPAAQPVQQMPQQRPIYQAFAPQDSMNIVDRLAAQGFEYAGCIRGEHGLRVAMKGPGRTYIFDMSLVRKSGISGLVECRV